MKKLLRNTQKYYYNIFEKGYYSSKALGFDLIPKGIEAGKEKTFDLKVGGDEDNGYHILLEEKTNVDTETYPTIDASSSHNVELAGACACHTTPDG